VPLVLATALTALIAALAVLLRRKRLSQTSADADLDLTALLDGHSWQLLHNDVFRPPPRPRLLAIGLGVGIHATVFALISMPALARAYAAHRHPHTRSLAAAAAAAASTSSSSLAALRASAQSAIPDGLWLLVCAYTLAGIIGCALGAMQYKLALGTRARAWRRVLLYTVLSPVVLGLCAYFIMMGAAGGVSMDKLFRLTLVWALVHCPLSLLGAMVGRGLVTPAAARAGSNGSSTRTRPVPHSWVTTHSSLVALAASLLPLAVSASMAWVVLPTAPLDTPAPLPSSPSLIALLLCQCAATAAAAVATTAVLLAHGSWRWHWPAALSGGVAPALLLALLALAVPVERGTVPVALVAVLGMGAVGYLAAFVFVNVVYRNKRE
jgi:transmembrane 9 superfamily protein 2/4